jgi:hypothetical protein
MSNILHLLTSTFTTCACGSRARDCALAPMERFVNADDELPPNPDDLTELHEPVDLGPLISKERGFRTRPKFKGASGMGGVEMWDSSPETSTSRDVDGDAEMADPSPPDGGETEEEEYPQRLPPHHPDLPMWDHSHIHARRQLRPPLILVLPRLQS